MLILVVYSTLMDFLLALCPYIIIHKLQMRKREKMNIIAVSAQNKKSHGALTNDPAGDELRMLVSDLVIHIPDLIPDGF